MSEIEKTSEETSNSFVRSLRRLSSSVFRFLFRRDRREPDINVGLDIELPNIFRYPPENSMDAFVVEDFARFQELLREESEKTDTALNFFADSQKDELDPSAWTVISEQQVNHPPRFMKPPVLSRWKLKWLFRRRGERNVVSQIHKRESPWLPEPQ